MSKDIKISYVVFKNYKALKNFSISIHQMNILVGPNNCGKSTIIGAFRILDIAMKKAKSKNADFIDLPDGKTFGYELSSDIIPISLENIHTNYTDKDTSVIFHLNNKNKMILYFPHKGRCIFIAESEKYGKIRSPGKFKSEFPLEMVIVPVMGPVEHEEEEKTIDTIKKGLTSHRASRHFRNYWLYFPEEFENFANLVKETWKGITIERPYKVDPTDTKLAMFCFEGRIPREIYWAGFGFQIWCQLLTHISRAKDKDIIIIDEPEIYLHPEVQRQLVNILRDLSIDILIATHSTEILSEADPSEILLIEKENLSAKRLKDIESVQIAMDKIGTLQNITLTLLAKNRKLLFIEGIDDYKILRRFAKKLNYEELSNGLDITSVESKGFSSLGKIISFAWGFKTAFKETLNVAAIFDRDYWCDEEIQQIENDFSNNISLLHIHRRKEIENYLLNPLTIQRLLIKILKEKEKRTGESFSDIISIYELLDEITTPFKTKILSQYLSKRNQYLKKISNKDESELNQETIDIFESKWQSIEKRMEIIQGKIILAQLRNKLQEKYGITLTTFKIIDEFKNDEIPEDIIYLLEKLETFRKY